MLFEIPLFGRKKKEEPVSPVPEGQEKGRRELEGEFRDLLRKGSYEETSAESGKDIIEGEGKETYSTVEKAGFLGAWSQDLSELTAGIPDIGKGRVGNAAYGTSIGLFVEWDADGVRPVWVKRAADEASGEGEEEREPLEIAGNFPFPVLEGAFDNAKAELERLKAESIRKGLKGDVS